jgi:hypothetical protein
MTSSAQSRTSKARALTPDPPRASPAPGDLVFAHSKGLIGRAIRLAERIRWRGGDAYNHVAVLAEQVGDDWRIIQAEARGVTHTGMLSTVAPGGTYVIVPLAPGIDAAKVLAFAQAQVGRRYGFLTVVSIIATILSPRFVDVMLPDTWICSAVAAESLRFGGWLHNWPDLFQVSPAQLWDALVS